MILILSRACYSWLLFNVFVLMYLIEQVERGAGTSGKTEKIQVSKHRRVKEDTDSDDSEFWMLKSSSGSESEQESDEENCKGASFCFFFVGSTFIFVSELKLDLRLVSWYRFSL